MTDHAIVSAEEWILARKDLLEAEKELTRMSDELSRQRRRLPWVKVEKAYRFEAPDGPASMDDLFAGRSQLLIYHFMFGPEWEEGCTGCSFLADHIDGANLHLAHHDVSVVAVSRAPLAKLLAFRERMGWRFPWVSSNGSDFNFDYHVSFSRDAIAEGRAYYNYEMRSNVAEEMHGLSVFTRNEAGEIFHTYSSYARGGDILLGTHHYLDLTPKGRNETSTMNWVRHHDRYVEHDPAPSSDRYVPLERLTEKGAAS